MYRQATIQVQAGHHLQAPIYRQDNPSTGRPHFTGSPPFTGSPQSTRSPLYTGFNIL
jgi:hypothetical protein